MNIWKKWFQRLLEKLEIITKDKDDRDGNYPPYNPPKPDTTPDSIPTTPQVPVGTDVLGWETIHWYGQNQARNAIPTKVLRSATVSGDMNVRLDYDTIDDWPACKVIPGCQASFMVFTTALDGALRGGHTDHLKAGCKTRDLGNFYNGYLIAGVPRNQNLYIAIASHDGRYRSNLVKAIRK